MLYISRFGKEILKKMIPSCIFSTLFGLNARCSVGLINFLYRKLRISYTILLRLKFEGVRCKIVNVTHLSYSHFTVSLQSLYSLYTVCLQSVYSLFTVCLQSVYSLFTVYLQSVYSLFTVSL